MAPRPSVSSIWVHPHFAIIRRPGRQVAPRSPSGQDGSERITAFWDDRYQTHGPRLPRETKPASTRILKTSDASAEMS
jgi:hypothetical protein